MLTVALKGMLAEVDTQEYRRGQWYGLARKGDLIQEAT